MAEGVFRSLTNNLPDSASPAHPRISIIDSAGTGAYHTLDPPDPRTVATLESHNIGSYDHGARKITAQDFDEFDYIMAMDRFNLRDLVQMKERLDRKKNAASKAQVRLFGEFERQQAGVVQGAGEPKRGTREAVVGEEVVDPYYGADNGFEVVFEQVERFSRAFLSQVVDERISVDSGAH